MPEAVVTRELRFDLDQGNVDKRRTTAGGIIVDANISRVGVFKYQNADGSERRELRLPTEVFAKKALDSFAHATLTVEHPPKLVDPASWKQVTVGHVGPTVERDGKYVSAELFIQDGPTIERINKGELRELSCGYQCRLDMTPGTHPEFGDYDAKQIDIIGNHVAIGGKDWGRAGPDVRMKLDSASGDHIAIGSYLPRMPGAVKTKTKAPPPETRDDAVDPEPEIDETTRVDEGAGELAALRAENARLKKEGTKRDDAAQARERQEREDARVEARTSLISAVIPILDSKDKPWKATGKTDDAIMREVLTELEPGVLEEPEAKGDSAAGFIRGAFKSVMARADRVAGGWRELGDTLSSAKTLSETRETRDGKGKPGGEEDEETVEDAQKSMVDKQRDAWKDGKRMNSRRPDKRDRGARDARR